MYIHVPYGHAVFFKKHFGTSSNNSEQASMYACSLVSVFCSHYFSVKQLTFEIYIKILITVLFRVLNGEINTLDCDFLSSSYGNDSHKSVGYVQKFNFTHRMYLKVNVFGEDPSKITITNASTGKFEAWLYLQYWR